ncbi:MAG: DUF948 domain-containing protein [Bacillota bacterium]|nr:DUF948 domain-containing protein [Bacillota bacterium]
MITININQVFLVILGIAGLVVLVSFAALLISLRKLVKEVNSLVDSKKTQINYVVDGMPKLIDDVRDLSDKTSNILVEVNDIVARSKNDINGIVHSVNTSMDDVNKITAKANALVSKVEHTAENVQYSVNSMTDNLIDVSSFFHSRKDNFFDYIYIFRDFFEEIRRILFARR